MDKINRSETATSQGTPSTKKKRHNKNKNNKSFPKRESKRDPSDRRFDGSGVDSRDGDANGPRMGSATNSNAMNDIAWYDRYPELLRSASKVPFVTRPGMSIGYGNYGTAEAQFTPIPGIMRIEYQAAVGTSTNSLSPVSACARGVYDQIRDAYSGNLQTQPADLFMYMMHLCQFRAYIAWLKRIYGVINFYTPFNRFAPVKLFSAMFPDSMQFYINRRGRFDDWVANKNSLLSCINQLVYMANKYIAPADMAVFSRQRWMNENVYTDDNSVLAQWYVFAPTGFWCVDGVNGENGTEMNFLPFAAADDTEKPYTVLNAYRYGLRLYKALADWGDALTMNGYIARAFSGKLEPPVDLLPEDYTVRPVYSLEVLMQIHNAKVFDEYSELKWTQDPLTHAILVNPAGTYDLTETLLDLPMDEPDQTSIVIASRLAPVIIKHNDGREDVNFMHCGTEIVKGVYITSATSNLDDPDFMSMEKVSFLLNNDLGSDEHRSDYLVKRLWLLSQYSTFNMAPMMHFMYRESGDNASNTLRFLTTYGHSYNVTAVDKQVLANMHLVCQQSEFNIYRPHLA